MTVLLLMDMIVFYLISINKSVLYMSVHILSFFRFFSLSHQRGGEWSEQLQSTSFPAGLNHGKGQDRAETGMEIFCQGIQDSSMSYGTEANQEISDLFKVLQAVCGKMRRKPQYPKSSKDYLPLKGNFFFHVRLTSHLALWERSLQHSYCWKNSLENNNKKKDVMINSLYLFSAETEKSD